MNNFKRAQNIFKKVAFSEKKRILKAIIEAKSQVLVKGESDDQPFILQAVQGEGHEFLFCHKHKGTKALQDTQKVVINFDYEQHRYFMQTELGFKGEWYVLPIANDLFQLQRRASVRIDIQDALELRFTIVNFAGQDYRTQAYVENISIGGLRIRYNADRPVLKIGDQLTGELRFAKRRPLELNVDVRFADHKVVENQPVRVVGLQFQNVDRILETRLLSLMMDLQHEAYKKTQKGEI